MKLRYTSFRLGFVLSLFTCFLFTACKNTPGDEQIQKNVSDKLSPNAGNNNYQGFSRVQAVTSQGVVTLTGECEGPGCGDSAATLVRDVEGVKDVVNNVEEVTTETDFTLRTSVQSIISKYEGVQADVAAGVVILRGQIQRAQIQPLMNELSALKPKKIDNQLAVK